MKMKSKIILSLLIYSILLGVRCSSDTVNLENSDKNKMQKSPYPNKCQLNLDLRAAAKNNVNYYDIYYSVITEQNVQVLNSKTLDSTILTLHRGDVFIKDHQAKKRNGFTPIALPGSAEIYYITNKSQHFDQAINGMRFPVIGVVQDGTQILTYYNKTTSNEQKIELKSGDSYFFVLKKDVVYVNVLPTGSAVPITGALEGQPNFCQVDDHIAIMNNYKTMVSRMLSQ